MTASRVIEIIRQVLGSHHLFRAEPEITAESRLDDIGADDLDRQGIAVNIETEFNFEISDQQVRDWNEVQDIIDIVGLCARTPEGSPA